MKIKFTIITIAILLIASGFTLAQSEGIQKGDKEILFSGYMSTNTNFDYGYANFFFSYSKYVTNRLSLGVGPTLSFSFSDDTESNLGLSIFTKYNFNQTKKTVPYASLSYYQYSFKTEGDTKLGDLASIQIGLGMKNFINEFLAVDSQLSYGFGLSSADNGGSLLLIIGLSYMF
ncbi:MAG: hypothetical protein K9H16_00880 [Bacteroidales bacterium]|nr:hypothetical protein [Bacteroidales bacterium]